MTKALANAARKMLARVQATQAARKANQDLISDLGTPADLARKVGLTLDPWQERALTSRHKRKMYLAARQVGKSLVAGCEALWTALTKPESLTLIISPSEPQSKEIYRDKVIKMWRALGRPLKAGNPTTLALELSNGSRILALPNNEETIRGYAGVSLIVIDEASRVPDALYHSVTPMISVCQGSVIALSTPNGQMGWFYNAWHAPDTIAAWDRYKITAEECPRHSKAFLEEERVNKGDKMFFQEYHCEFLELSGAAFLMSDIMACLTD